MMIKRSISAAILTTIALILFLVTCTSIFSSLASSFPQQSDLLFYVIAYASFSIAALPLKPPNMPNEALWLLSVALAILLEIFQLLLVQKRPAKLAYLFASAFGSFVIFLIPKEGRLVLPSWPVLMTYLLPEDDDDMEDSHRVGSWAV